MVAGWKRDTLAQTLAGGSIAAKSRGGQHRVHENNNMNWSEGRLETTFRKGWRLALLTPIVDHIHSPLLDASDAPSETKSPKCVPPKP
jgi:hypothetical protein